MAGPSWQLLCGVASLALRVLSLSRDVARGGRVGRARPPRAGRLVLAARALLLVPRVDRFGLHAAAVATRRSVRALHDLPAALSPVEVDAPLQRLRRVSNACCSNPPPHHRTLTPARRVLPHSLFCRECSSHRVASELPPPAPPTLRVCDRCAFSPSHPEHLGCERPCECPRCSRPRNYAQFTLYTEVVLRLILCCAWCPVGTRRKPAAELAMAAELPPLDVGPRGSGAGLRRPGLPLASLPAAGLPSAAMLPSAAAMGATARDRRV